MCDVISRIHYGKKRNNILASGHMDNLSELFDNTWEALDHMNDRNILPEFYVITFTKDTDTLVPSEIREFRMYFVGGESVSRETFNEFLKFAKN